MIQTWLTGVWISGYSCGDCLPSGHPIVWVDQPNCLTGAVLNTGGRDGELPLSASVLHRLIVTKGTDEGKQFRLDGGPLLIGRDPTAKVRLSDTEISRRHAELTLSPEGYRLRDLGSVNGTLVNGRAIQDVLLVSGDRLLLGQTQMVYVGANQLKPAPGFLAERINLLARKGEGGITGTVVSRMPAEEGDRLLRGGGQGEGEWLRRSLANLGVMYETASAINHILDLDELLNRILELVFRSMDADRGCVLLADPDTPDPLSPAAFTPKAVRWRGGLHGAPPPGVEGLTVSKTLIEQVLTRKEGVLVSDAATDQRFQTAPSIVQSRVREILCVPMKGRNEVLGLLYVDTTRDTSPSDWLKAQPPEPAFQEDHLKLAMAIGHLAALAVEENRNHHALLQAERLAAVGTAMASLSHHIKNILQGLKSGTEIISLGLDAGNLEMARQGWRIMDRNQQRIYDLVLDMLSYSKEREPSLEPMDLAAVLKDVVSLEAGHARDKGVSLVLKGADEAFPLVADGEGIHRLLMNLVGNAVDATAHLEDDRGEPVEGRVEVLLGSEESNGQAGEDGWARVEVLDNGPGVPEEMRREIFKPFVSTKGSKGTGLGLPVSRKIAQEHGGDLWLLENQPSGCRFVLRLPARKPGSGAVDGALGNLGQTVERNKDEMELK